VLIISIRSASLWILLAGLEGRNICARDAVWTVARVRRIKFICMGKSPLADPELDGAG
jgi:hypothetical protein